MKKCLIMLSILFIVLLVSCDGSSAGGSDTPVSYSVNISTLSQLKDFLGDDSTSYGKATVGTLTSNIYLDGVIECSFKSEKSLNLGSFFIEGKNGIEINRKGSLTINATSGGIKIIANEEDDTIFCIYNNLGTLVINGGHYYATDTGTGTACVIDNTGYLTLLNAELVSTGNTNAKGIIIRSNNSSVNSTMKMMKNCSLSVDGQRTDGIWIHEGIINSIDSSSIAVSSSSLMATGIECFSNAEIGIINEVELSVESSGVRCQGLSITNSSNIDTISKTTITVISISQNEAVYLLANSSIKSIEVCSINTSAVQSCATGIYLNENTTIESITHTNVVAMQASTTAHVCGLSLSGTIKNDPSTCRFIATTNPNLNYGSGFILPNYCKNEIYNSASMNHGMSASEAVSYYFGSGVFSPDLSLQ